VPQNQDSKTADELLDSELLALASEHEAVAMSIRDVVMNANTIEHIKRVYGNLNAYKRKLRDDAARALAALRGLRAHDGAPFVDARWLLTDAILFEARCMRALASGDPKLRQARARIGADRAAAVVAEHYPVLATRMREPERIARIEAAIASASTTARRRPWRLIAACFDGIEAQPISPEAWRVEYKKRTRNRP
jgi:hypothetical protein